MRTARFGTGDRVSAPERIGVFGTRVPAGTCGVVAGITVVGEMEVHFDNGRVELVTPDRLRLEDFKAST